MSSTLNTNQNFPANTEGPTIEIEDALFIECFAKEKQNQTPASILKLSNLHIKSNKVFIDNELNTKMLFYRNSFYPACKLHFSNQYQWHEENDLEKFYSSHLFGEAQQALNNNSDFKIGIISQKISDSDIDCGSIEFSDQLKIFPIKKFAGDKGKIFVDKDKKVIIFNIKFKGLTERAVIIPSTFVCFAKCTFIECGFYDNNLSEKDREMIFQDCTFSKIINKIDQIVPQIKSIV